MSKAALVNGRPGAAEVFDTTAKVLRLIVAVVNSIGPDEGLEQLLYLAEHGNRDMRELYGRWDDGRTDSNMAVASSMMDARCILAAAHGLAFLLKHYKRIAEIAPGETLDLDEYSNALCGVAYQLEPLYRADKREEWIRKHEPDG